MSLLFIPDVSTASCTSAIPEDDIGNDLGLYINLTVPAKWVARFVRAAGLLWFLSLCRGGRSLLSNAKA